MPIPLKAFGHDRILTGVLTEGGGRLLLAVVDTVDLGPLGPGVVRQATVRWPVQNLELHQALASLAQGSSHAVSAGVAAADNHYILVPGSHHSGPRNGIGS